MLLFVDSLESMTNLKASNRERSLVDKFGDQGGFFDVVVRPKFQHGHEGELCSWLKESSLIRTTLSCPQAECKGRTLAWHSARIIDRYNWVCPACNKKQSIREGSFFFGIKGDFKATLQAILAWCQNLPSDETAAQLEIKEHIVRRVYERCASVTESYIKTHPEDFKIGGPNIVLLVDEFPGGYMCETPTDVTVSKKRNNNCHNILCIAEANAFPPRMWIHMITAIPETMKIENDDSVKLRCGRVEEALSEIVRYVLPGSYLVANSRTRYCNYETLQELKQYKVFSVENLQKFDAANGNKLIGNLGTIWRDCLSICEDIQETSSGIGQQIIAEYLWRRRFGPTPSVAFQCMLNHITECYRFV